MINRERIRRALRNSWSPQTSTKWTRANPALGQCSVTALVILDRFGGELLKTRIGDAWHFYNVIGGEIYDFTADQFDGPPMYHHERATRDEALMDTSREQYRHLRKAFATSWESLDRDVPVIEARVVLVGDYDSAVKAHQAIPRALALASDAAGYGCTWEWLHTETILADPSEQLARFHGIWCVPASPYANTRGALAAIRFARQSNRPFLGTCGGYQHVLLEYAEAVWGVTNAAHAEVDPGASDPVIAPLTCSLVERSGEILFEPRSRLATIYGAPSAFEEYHCRYGLSAAYVNRLAAGSLRVSARDAAGDVRAVELSGHPFFVATLFQPERSALVGRQPPLVRAFLDAAYQQAQRSNQRMEPTRPRS